MRTGGDSISVKGADAVLGTAFGDEIIGNNNGNALVGGGGADIIKGGSGNDRLVGGNKVGDTYSDDSAVDTITSGGGTDWIYFSNQDHVTDRTGASRLFFANGTPRPAAAFARAILPVGGSEGSASYPWR